MYAFNTYFMVMLKAKAIRFAKKLAEEKAKNQSEQKAMEHAKAFAREGLKRLTRKVNVFNYSLIFIPVHVNNMHWTLITINVDTKNIVYYDSLYDETNAFYKEAEAVKVRFRE